MGEVTSIDGTPFKDTRIVQEDIIKEAEWLLERCRAGEIVGMEVAFSYHDHSAGFLITGRTDAALLGQAVRAVHKLMDF